MKPVPNAVRGLVIAAAGMGSFYGAAQWSEFQRQQGDHGDQADAVIELAPRVASAAMTGPATVSLPAAPSPAGARTPADGDPLLASAARSRSIPRSAGDLFARLSWLPPAPPPPPPAPPAPPPPPPARIAPTAPPLPFAFIGMIEKGGLKPEAFLAKDEALLIVAVGDLLENNTYRVDALSANEVVMTYLPLKTRQTLNTKANPK